MPKTPDAVRRDHDITLKQVPRDLVNAILAFAAEDHRSMSGEILFILEQYVDERRQREKEKGN